MRLPASCARPRAGGIALACLAHCDQSGRICCPCKDEAVHQGVPTISLESALPPTGRFAPHTHRLMTWTKPGVGEHMELNIICADWSVFQEKRAAYLASTRTRSVRRVQPASWSLASLLDGAHGDSAAANLIGVDVPLGVPRTFLEAARREPPWRSTVSFPAWLTLAIENPSFMLDSDPAGWSVRQPFFKAPEGTGALRAVLARLGQRGISLFRDIERATSGKSVFISGLPGQVSPAARSLWRELASLLVDSRTFRLWPFDGELDVLLTSGRTVLGEIYPRAAYGIVLKDSPAAERPRLALSKTNPGCRLRAISLLQSAEWIRRHRVRLSDLDAAAASEDDFDAFVTALALLRCHLEGLPLGGAGAPDVLAEGGILGLSGINLGLPEESFSGPGDGDGLVVRGPSSRRASRAPGGTGRLCPIPRCGYRFLRGRLGWDAHVGSPERHPHWHPELEGADVRKVQFRREFPKFFALGREE